MKDLFKNIPLDKKNLTVIAICALVFFYIDITFVMKPQLKGLNALKPKIAKLKTDLGELAKDAARMQEFNKKGGMAAKPAGVSGKIIIQEEQLASLLQEISVIANKDEVKILQMRPAHEVPQAQGSPAASAGLPETVLINLDLLCGYHALGKFLNDLENMQVIVSVQNLKISAQATDILKQKAALGIKTYVRK